MTVQKYTILKHFTYHPHIFIRNRNDLQRITVFWPELLSRPAEGRRLSSPSWPCQLLHTNMVYLRTFTYLVGSINWARRNLPYKTKRNGKREKLFKNRLLTRHTKCQFSLTVDINEKRKSNAHM